MKEPLSRLFARPWVAVELIVASLVVSVLALASAIDGLRRAVAAGNQTG